MADKESLKAQGLWDYANDRPMSHASAADTSDKYLSFLDRLKQEYADLCAKTDALTLFIQRGAPKASSNQRLLLDSQLAAMNLYRRTLDLRLQDLALQPSEISEYKTTRAASEEIGEPVEIGGHDEDRDGPVKFDG